MFEKLYRDPITQARHRAAPLAQERECYLQYRAEQGATILTLQEMARKLLWVAIKLNPPQGSNITMEQIREVASWKISQQRNSPLKNPMQVRQRIIGTAVAWLRYLNRLQPSQAPQLRHESLIVDYARWMKYERTLFPGTIAQRLFVCRQFLIWYEKQDVPFSKVSVKDVDTFIIASNKHQRWARSTTSTNLGNLRDFFRYAADHGACSHIMKYIAIPRIYRWENLPLGPKRNDVVRLVSSMQTDRPTDIRDLAMIQLCAVYGLRASEVVGLRIEDIDWEKDQLHIWRTKSRKRQNFTLVTTVGNSILRYLKEVRPLCDRQEVFLCFRAPIRPIAVATLSYIVHYRMAALNIHAQRMGAHSLRHAFGCHLLEGKFSLKEIGDLMGHKKGSTTQIYAKVDLPILRNVAVLDLGGII